MTSRRGALAGLVGAATLFVSGCGVTVEDEPRYPYPEDAQENFTAGCEGTSGGQTEYCTCLLDEFQNTVPFEDFARIDREILQGGLQGLAPEDRELFQASVMACEEQLEN